MKNNQRFCAHRGFNTIAPENSILAFSSAIVLGVSEIELDLWPTKDGKLLVMHDSTVDRTTNGKGMISELISSEINKLDNGSYFSNYFAGLRVSYFEEVLAAFDNKVTMNIHVKSLTQSDKHIAEMMKRYKKLGYDYTERIYENLFNEEVTVNVNEAYEERRVKSYDKKNMQKIVDLVYEYGYQDSVYITGEKDVLQTALEIAPEIERCCLEGHMNYTIVENAIKYKCSRVQFCKGYVNEEMITYAHQNNIICNLFWSDNPIEAKQFFDMGIDVILTNDLLRTSALKNT